MVVWILGEMEFSVIVIISFLRLRVVCGDGVWRKVWFVIFIYFGDMLVFEVLFSLSSWLILDFGGDFYFVVLDL